MRNLKKNRNNSLGMLHRLPTPVSAQFRAWEYCRSLAGIVDLKPTGGGGVKTLLLWVSCVFRRNSVLLADHLCRGVLPNVVCLSVIEKDSGRGVIQRGMSIHDTENIIQ